MTTPFARNAILSVVTADWNNDGSFDRALLIASETEPDQADLLVYLSESTDNMRLAVSKKNIAWRGAMWGTQLALEFTGRGSLSSSLPTRLLDGTVGHGN